MSLVSVADRWLTERVIWGLGAGLRLCLLLFGVFQDHHFAVKFTDVDYTVFSDAARYVSAGRSPFDRATYRYSPLLAWLLVPNVWLPMWGKLLFVLADLAVAALAMDLLATTSRVRRGGAVWRFALGLALLNPITSVVSARGNAESLVAAAVLLSLGLMYRGRIALAGAAFGFAVHLKIYPILYSVALALHLADPPQSAGVWGSVAAVLRSRRVWTFAVPAAATLASLTGLFYALYGYQFLHEGYIYHLVRTDHRHNFSVYFLDVYLGSAGGALPALAGAKGVLMLLPPLAVSVALAFGYYRNLAACLFLQTFAFVAFNKVVTVQYFVWFFSLLPVAWPSLAGPSKGRWALLWAAWYGAQLVWLKCAYDLEFNGLNTFLNLFAASLAYFVANMTIIARAALNLRGNL